MSKDDDSTVVNLDAFRKNAQEEPADCAYRPHEQFQDLLSKPQIAAAMLPDVIRMILPKLEFQFAADGQKNPKILEDGGIPTATLTISAYSFTLDSFQAMAESHREYLRENDPGAYRAVLRQAWAASARMPPEEEENQTLQRFVYKMIADTVAYKETARILREADIDRLSFGPAIRLNAKANDPHFLCVEPCIKLSTPISRHGDIRTVLRDYLDRVDQENRPNGQPDLRPV